MVAALHDTHPPDEDERKALEWLEGLPPPAISASPAVRRSLLTHYVPVNDAQVLGLSLTARQYNKLSKARAQLSAASTESQRIRGEAALVKARDVANKVTRVGTTPTANAVQLLPAGRPRQARAFPSVTPEDSTVSFLWEKSDLDRDHLDALSHLIARVTRLGHSSSLTWCRLDQDPPAPTWVPDVDGTLDVRTIGQGQLAALERRFTRHQGVRPRALPAPTLRYRDARATSTAELTSVLSGEWLLFAQVSGPRLDLRNTVALSRAVRGALMAHLVTDIPPLLSGHAASGGPAQHPHLAVVPLPFVGFPHASGQILGFALLLPRESPLLAGRDRVLRAIGLWEGSDRHGDAVVTTAGSRLLRFQRLQSVPSLVTLDRSRWEGRRPCTSWVTATPIALGRHPGHLGHHNPRKADAAAARARDEIRRACGFVGLPAPSGVTISRAPLLRGSAPVHRFPAFQQGRPGVRRALIHCALTFETPVRGPILLGAGRHLGLGLMIPELQRSGG